MACSDVHCAYSARPRQSGETLLQLVLFLVFIHFYVAVSAKSGCCVAIRGTDVVNATNSLGALTQVARDKNGWSTRDHLRRVENLGLDMKHSNFSRLKNQELISIKGTVIHALAEVHQVSVLRVAQAAMASMGVEVQAERSALEDVVRDSQEFSAPDRQIIQGLVDTIRTLDATNQEEAAANATQMSQAGNTPANPQGKKVPYVDPEADEFGRVPLPANYYELAASGHPNLGAEEDARERGEESQETTGDETE